jgi:hypothetical protein
MEKEQEVEEAPSRRPPTAIRRRLRQEVGFGCPIPGCGNPYLYWHHFDPPWEPEHVHREEGMIALCGEHHPKADAGAFTKEQLREYKKNGKQLREEAVKGQFDWLRQRLLAAVGGNFCYETLMIFRIGIHPVIWFTRDENNYLGLNINMVTNSGQARIVMEENFWIIRGEPDDFECPPSGKLIHARYANGDELRIEFRELFEEQEAVKRYPSRKNFDGVDFPITAVEVLYRIGGTNISFDKDGTTVGPLNIKGGLSIRMGCAILIE